MNRTLSLLALSIPVMTAILPNGAAASARPSASKPATTQPAYPLWDGNESVADYAKRAGIKDVQVTLALDGNVTMKLTLIPAGRFLMGSPRSERLRVDEYPQHEVTISNPHYMGVYVVTQSQWRTVLGTGVHEQRDKESNSWPSGSWPLAGVSADSPMYYVSWDEANQFCVTLSQKVGKVVRLPTEAEWEYACRAGTRTRFWFGDDANNLGEFAWFLKNSDANSHPVGQKKPNNWGLYDIHGNVFQWCADWYDVSYGESPVVDPRGPSASTGRVIRGGSWRETYRGCRSASRTSSAPFARGKDIGFRVVVDLPAARAVESPSTPATNPAGATTSSPATSQPVYPLWDGNESVADYAKRAGIKDVQMTLPLDGNVTMKLTLIPAGKFMMGSPANEKGRRDNESQHEVTISKPFYMGICEVTQGQYEQVMGKNPSAFKEPQNPVESVPWGDAAEFCKKLSQKTGMAVTLSTEAQWEYSCRAGTATPFCCGEDPGKLGDYAWYAKNSEGKTHAVGQKKPNAFGLYDMCGSVWEWCSDKYDKDYGAGDSNVDPQGPATGTSRVLRGGCWNYGAEGCRSAFRSWNSLGHRSGCGFRIVVDLPATRPVESPVTRPSGTPAPNPSGPGSAEPAPDGG